MTLGRGRQSLWRAQGRSVRQCPVALPAWQLVELLQKQRIGVLAATSNESGFVGKREEPREQNKRHCRSESPFTNVVTQP